MAKSELWGGPHDGMVVDTNPGQGYVDVPRYEAQPWGDKTDVGARCPKCNMLLAPCWRCGKPSQCGEAWCGDCAPEGGWNAPSAALSQPVSAEQPSGVAESTPDPPKAAQGGYILRRLVNGSGRRMWSR